MHTSASSSSSSTSSLPPPTTTFSAIPDDILRTHILTLLDGPTLASLSCTSKHLHSLIASSSSSSSPLWSHICHTTWPSTLSPLLRHVIPSFPPKSHLSFFSLSYPVLTPSPSPSSTTNPICQSPTQNLISAVDIFHRGKLIFSTAAETETIGGWFDCSPFRIDMLEPKEVVPTTISYSSDDTWQELGEDLTVSWILVDPQGKRAANVSSDNKAVKVEKHWLSGEVHARFGSVMCGEKGTGKEYVECGIVVRCGGVQGKVEVREASLQVEDMDGTVLSGKEGLRVLEKSAFGGSRGGRREGLGRRRYEEFLERKREREEMKARREGTLDCLCTVGFGLVAVLGFWFFLLCR